MSKLRIAFLAGTLGQGGAERQLYFIISVLKDLGCKPVVITFSRGEFWEGPIQNLGVEVISILDKSPIARIRKLVKYIKQGDYGYIHSQHFYTNLYAVITSWWCRTKCIGSIRNNTISEVAGMGIWGWFSLILPEQIAANSYSGIKNARKYLRNSNKVVFLPNYIDGDLFFPNAKKEKTSKFKVVTVGTIWKPKRIDRVIAIAELINKRSNDIVFEIVGDGDEFNSMVNLAESKSLLNASVFFRGRLNDIAGTYRSANVLLLTSDHEGTPNVVLEAMACGLPVITTNVGDVIDIIKNGITGYIVEKDQIEKCADLIEMLSNNRQLCEDIGNRAREFVLHTYSREKLIKGLKTLYFPIFFH